MANWVLLKEASLITGHPTTRLRIWIKQGLIRHARVGSRYLLCPEMINEDVAAMAQGSLKQIESQPTAAGVVRKITE